MNDRPDLDDLYRTTVLIHSREPHNRRRLPECASHATGFNPLCGDKVDVYANIEDDVIRELTFEGMGCAISIASASMMTEALTDASIDKARETIAQFSDTMLDRGGAMSLPGDLAALSGVRAYPSRVKCAILPWATLGEAIDQSGLTATTE